MGSCNVVQNELGGKELLLKVCKEAPTVSSTDESTTFTYAAHGLRVGDLIRVVDKATLTVVTNGDFYFVIAVPTANTFQIAATKIGTAIEADATSAVIKFDLFKTFGGLRSKSFSFSSDAIDITNGDSDEWKNILDKAGVRSFSVSGSGVYTNESAFQDAQTSALANELICMMFIDVKSSRIWVGCMKITSLEISGDYDAESNYSVSAESSGPVEVQLVT